MKTNLLGLLLTTSVAVTLIACPALAAGKVALVIGNAAYEHSPLLDNPIRDAKVVAETFEALGFETIYADDLTRREFAAVLVEFRDALEGADVAAFYYAGHGIQYEGQNYLVTVEAELVDPIMLPGETIALDLIIETMEAKSPLNMLFLDACRKNQFAARLTRGPTPIAQGLAPTTVLGSDTLVMYATASNNVAFDGVGENSPFAASLVQHLPAPDTEIGIAMKRVIRDVREATGGRQSPEMLTTVAVEYYLKKSPEVQSDRVVAAAATLPPTATVPEALLKLEELFELAHGYRLSNDRGGQLVALVYARDLSTWFFGEDSLEYARANQALVGILTEMNRLDDAIYASTEVIRVYSKLQGGTALPVLTERINLAYRLAMVGRFEGAERLYDEVIDHFESRSYVGGEALTFAYALHSRSAYMALRGRQALALEYSTRSVEIDIPQSALSHVLYGQILRHHAFMLDRNGDCDGASTFAKNAMNVLSAAGMAESHPDFSSSRDLANRRC